RGGRRGRGGRAGGRGAGRGVGERPGRRRPAATRALLRVSAAPLPPAFRTRVRGLLGPEAEELLDALETPRDPAVRLNPLRGELADLAALLRWPAAPVPWCPAGRSVAAASAAVAAHPLNDRSEEHTSEL